MRRFALWPVLLVMLLAASCTEKPATIDDFYTRPVRLPNGKIIRSEIMLHPTDMARGMMFRDSLAPGHGMLFLHGEAGKYSYWMHNVRIPLDIIWMDKDRRIVEMSLHTPPCNRPSAKECPTYGGTVVAQVVLELPGGEAQKQGLKLGDVLSF
jgi:hypothetical protein